jgi:hypothetical protein
MRHTILPNLALAGFLSLCGCNQSEPSPPTARTPYTFSATDGSLLRSTLVIDDASDRQHLAGVTQFADGGCLEEDATLDRSGRLLRAEYTLTRSNASTSHVVVDAHAGVVEVAGPVFPMRWTIARDLPWVFAPTVDGTDGTHTIATPLAALVTFRGAQAAGAVRQIDLGALTSHSVMVDQVVVPDGQSNLVVVGDDAVSVRGGLPEHWHVEALSQDLQADIASERNTLDAFACMPSDRSES